MQAEEDYERDKALFALLLKTHQRLSDMHDDLDKMQKTLDHLVSFHLKLTRGNSCSER